MKNYHIYLGLVLLAVVPLRGNVMPAPNTLSYGASNLWLKHAEAAAEADAKAKEIAEDKEFAKLGDELNTLGWQYYHDKNYAKAVKAFSAAAKGGHDKGMCSLGEMYALGTGLPKDNFEAARWFYRSAKKNYAPAQYRIGLMLSRGVGVPKDLVQAHVWLNLAGANGIEKATDDLELLEKKMTDSQKETAMEFGRQAFAKYRP